MSDQNPNLSSASGNPEEALAEFFDQYSHEESKTMLAMCYQATASGNFEALQEIDRENIATFYERLGILLGAVYSLKTKGDR
jgi:hypothetical protein